ncbi:uncharacterized protein LOC111637870 [Centruroides sculpturatus]|uniref:uncharacterized protein LOC111637870 n=1 Tax=Centruroides sculpturatus TaxID=218467 RepID=UPI000C6EFCF1|nr:uncharacterized protein LOC111637870 [Centruroides sculpturatus]
MKQIKWGKTIQAGSTTFTHNDIEWPLPYCDSTFPGNPIVNISENITTADMDIYTDGSKLDGEVGCSFVAYTGCIETYNQKYRLDKNCSVFQAELLAIQMAIDWINDNFYNIVVHIYTDSMSACNIIHSMKPHPVAENIRNKINASSCTFGVYWTRSHQGTPGNERADSLAKAAALDPTISISYRKLSRNTLRTILWEEAVNIWQTTWNQNNHCITHNFIPNLRDFLSLDWYTPDYHISQLLTNHGKFASYLYRFAHRTSNHCPTCLVEDGTKHYLYDCVMMDSERTELRLLLYEIGIEWPCQPKDIWTNREIFSSFKRLTRKITHVTHQIINC